MYATLTAVTDDLPTRTTTKIIEGIQIDDKLQKPVQKLDSEEGGFAEADDVYKILDS